MLKDELLGLADNPECDEIFKNHNLDMNVLYRSGETHQVNSFAIELSRIVDTFLLPLLFLNLL